MDPAASFTGEQVRGYWPDPKAVRWKPAAVADLDTRVVLGGGGQVWYGATWLHVPADAALDVRFEGHAQTFVRWTLNGRPAPAGTPVAGADNRRPESAATLPLKAGWNKVAFRAYCVGYPPFRVGLVLDGPADALWTVKMSAVPPAK